MAHPEAARLSFELVDAVTQEGPENAVSLDNMFGLLTVVDDFAAVAGHLQEQQQQRGRRAETLTSAKYVVQSHYFLYIDSDLSCLSSPVIDRGKKAVDLLPMLHKKLVSWLEAGSIDGPHGQFDIP